MHIVSNYQGVSALGMEPTFTLGVQRQLNTCPREKGHSQSCPLLDKHEVLTYVSGWPFVIYSLVVALAWSKNQTRVLLVVVPTKSLNQQ